MRITSDVMTEYRDLLPVIVEQEGAVLPDGCDSWAIKSVRSNLRTRGGFRWAHPGGTSRSDHNTDRDNTSACPNRVGDGLCVAITWQGMASGLISARTLLLVAYHSSDVLGRDDKHGKLRIGGAVHVVSLIDGERLVREHGAGANMSGANLSWTNLRGADLAGANLSGANLAGVNLSGADLYRADLAGTNLAEANLTEADLTVAYLTRADLAEANLYRAELTGTNLAEVNLTRADLTEANLAGANLAGANLTGADLTEADLSRADLAGADLSWAYLAGVRVETLPSGWTLTDAGMAVQS